MSDLRRDERLTGSRRALADRIKGFIECGGVFEPDGAIEAVTLLRLTIRHDDLREAGEARPGK